MRFALVLPGLLKMRANSLLKKYDFVERGSGSKTGRRYELRSRRSGQKRGKILTFFDVFHVKMRTKTKILIVT